MPEIFVSYRRDDTGGHARSLFTQLNQRFADRVFLDWEGIDIGEDFVAKLEAIGQNCRVLLALIGPRWLNVADAAGQRRIMSHVDHVRREIERALERGIPVVPVLFDGAAMPGDAELPASLRPLALRNAVSVTNANFGADMERLIRGLEELLGESQATVIHAVRKEDDWTSSTAFGKQVSIEFTFTPKRKQILWMTVGLVALVTVILAVVFMSLLS
jgi:hypothetical protein